RESDLEPYSHQHQTPGEGPPIFRYRPGQQYENRDPEGALNL
ncbi:MAG: hypothetical protein RJB62_1882, partial [Pseudomonadota bacterium]